MSQSDMTYDIRVVHHNIRRKLVSHADHKDYLASLPDDAEEAVESEVRFSSPYADRVASGEPMDGE